MFLHKHPAVASRLSPARISPVFAIGASAEATCLVFLHVEVEIEVGLVIHRTSMLVQRHALPLHAVLVLVLGTAILVHDRALRPVARGHAVAEDAGADSSFMMRGRRPI